MSDTIGRIVVPTPTNSGLVFPLISNFGFGVTRGFSTVTHRMGELATLGSQTFATGIGPRKFTFKRATLSFQERTKLVNFYEAVQGSFQSFQYNAPTGESRTATSPYQVIFETTPLSIDGLVNACKTGITFIECPDPSSAPVYTISETCTRFPSDALAHALTSQVQQIIPLIHIRVREAAVPDIYLSDRRCTVGDITYLPRVLNMGEAGSDVIMSQNINGQSDQLSFTFGNADRAMTQLANDTDLKYASIDISLYHVQSGALLQLWKGFLQSFVSDGSANFTVQCSDGLFQVMAQYPTRTVSRNCWKTFDDGVACPYSTKGSGGDPTQCDFTFSGPLGCVSHSMEPYFGGQPVIVQGITVKDNSTGFWGFDRDQVTATSIVSDGVWGKALPEIWCNDQGDPGKTLYCTPLMVDVRDEGDWFRGFGIIGSGPISKFTTAQVYQNQDGFRYVICALLDGQTYQGFSVDDNLNLTAQNTLLGIREIPGTDPTFPADVSYDMFEMYPFTAGTTNKAAGTAFVELLISTPKAPISPTAVEAHNMTIPISQGLAGWTWTADGTRTLTPGLTDPFWIAINVYLRALGLQDADSETQLATFVLSSLVNVDGVSGCSDIASLTVDAILGGGTETQFVFNGVLDTQKPVRDWLTEILQCCLGFYTFEWGRLKLGIRENSGSVSAFTLGNMVFQSLSTSPIEAAFEHILIDFADQAYQFQRNIGEYCDKDHAAYYGRQNSPLTARQHSVGISNLSQALRVGVTRVREEVGGINPAEWLAARSATWKTTILALDTAVGQNVSISHPDIPNGYGDFRISGWKLFKDWSIQIQAKTVTTSMFDLDQGPKPADVAPDGLPVLFYPQPQGEWEAQQVRANEFDALFAYEFTYDLSQLYIPATDGTFSPQCIARGLFPVNSYIPNCGPPNIKAGYITESTTDGFLPGGLTIRVAVCAMDALNRLSPPSEIILVTTPKDTGTNSFTLNDIQWPTAPVNAELVSWVLFAGTSDDLICVQQSGPLAGTSPTSITQSAPISRSLWAIPNSRITNVRLKAKLLRNVGASGELVSAIDGNSFTLGKLTDPDLIDNWAGRVAMVVGRNNESSPYGTWNILAYDCLSGTFVVDRPVTVDGHREQSIEVGDGVIVCFLGYDNSANPYRIEDAAGLSSHQNLPSSIPHSGLVPSTEKGYILRVIAGMSRGKTSRVVDNDAVGFTLDTAITIDKTSVWLVEDSTWTYSADSSPISNSSFATEGSVTLGIPNFGGTGLLIAGTTVSANGESGFGDLPCRVLYVYGAGTATDECSFVFGQGDNGGYADCAVGNITNAPTSPAAGTFASWTLNANVAPVGADLVIDILLIPAGSTDATSIFSPVHGVPLPTLPDGTYTSTGTVFFTQTIAINDRLQGVVMQVGSTVPGQSVTLQVFY